MPTNHIVKSWPEYFAAVKSGSKPFELRFNDRKYMPGDTITMREFDDRAAKYTGQELTKRITYVTVGMGGGAMTPLRGLALGYAILGLADVQR